VPGHGVTGPRAVNPAPDAHDDDYDDADYGSNEDDSSDDFEDEDE
jgi:hypothetical protein